MVAFWLDWCVALWLAWVALTVVSVVVGAQLGQAATQGSLAVLHHPGWTFFLALCAYRAIATRGFGTTLGKSLLGMKVVTADRGSRPGLAPLLLREFIGYPVSAYFLGAGYWTPAPRTGRRWRDFFLTDPFLVSPGLCRLVGRGQARADRAFSDLMAGTRVVRTRLAGRRNWVLGSGLVVVTAAALILFDVGLQRMKVAQQSAAERAAVQAAAAKESTKIHATLVQIRALRADSPDTLDQLRTQARKMQSLSEKWDAELGDAWSILHRGETLGVYPRDKARVMESVLILRHESAKAMEEEAALEIAFDPARQAPAALEREVRALESKIQASARRANALMKRAGLPVS